MPPITLRTFVDGLEALSVTGMVRSYTRGPPRAATAVPDLPAMFVAYPGQSGSRLVFGNQGGRGELRARIWIAIKPVVQDLQGVNFDAAVDMADALEAALVAASCAIGGVLTWDIDVTTDLVAGQSCWMVIAQIGGGRW
jgi:hypothetical protein